MVTGKCIGGPYDGQLFAMPDQCFPVHIKLGGVMDAGYTTINYQWTGSAWLWPGEWKPQKQETRT